MFKFNSTFPLLEIISCEFYVEHNVPFVIYRENFKKQILLFPKLLVALKALKSTYFKGFIGETA